MDYYQTTFNIMDERNWSPEYIDNLIPFERDLYFGLLLNKKKAEATIP